MCDAQVCGVRAEVQHGLDCAEIFPFRVQGVEAELQFSNLGAATSQ